jgi:uncharacterized protein YjiS (DUF1127 family)
MPLLSELSAMLGARMVRTLNALLAWRERARERSALAAMDDRALRDIGVCRAETWVEVEKPFWRS